MKFRITAFLFILFIAFIGNAYAQIDEGAEDTIPLVLEGPSSPPVMDMESAAEDRDAVQKVPDTPEVSQGPDALPESDILPDVKQHESTHPEKIIFAYHKLAKDTPDFDSMSQASPRVQKAQGIDKSTVAMSEYNRISNSYNVYDETEIIAIQTTLKVDEYSELQDLIAFNELDNETFFRYSFYGENIGIVPEDIAKFNRIQISKPRAEAMLKALNGSKDVTAEFLLKPVYADKERPVTYKDKDYVLMLAKIAEVRLWAASDALVWYYRAPWYMPEDKANISDLFVEPSASQGP